VQFPPAIAAQEALGAPRPSRLLVSRIDVVTYQSTGNPPALYHPDVAAATRLQVRGGCAHGQCRRRMLSRGDSYWSVIRAYKRGDLVDGHNLMFDLLTSMLVSIHRHAWTRDSPNGAGHRVTTEVTTTPTHDRTHRRTKQCYQPRKEGQRRTKTARYEHTATYSSTACRRFDSCRGHHYETRIEAAPDTFVWSRLPVFGDS
jgi:hypothetical protein